MSPIFNLLVQIDQKGTFVNHLPLEDPGCRLLAGSGFQVLQGLGAVGEVLFSLTYEAIDVARLWLLHVAS